MEIVLLCMVWTQSVKIPWSKFLVLFLKHASSRLGRIMYIYVYMLNMLSFPLLRCELMNVCSSCMMVSVIDLFPLFSCWDIFYCWLITVWGLACSIYLLRTLYTVIIMTCLFCLPRIVAHDHLRIPLESSPCFVTLGFNDGSMIVWIPPGFYGVDNCIIDSKLYADARFNLPLMILLNSVRVFFTFSVRIYVR